MSNASYTPSGGRRRPCLGSCAGTCGSVLVSLLFAYLAYLLPLLYPGNKPLYDAVKQGDIVQVRSLLAHGADPNSRSAGLLWLRSRHQGRRRNAYYEPVLMTAVNINRPDIARLLLDHGARVDARGPSDRTPLMQAVYKRQREMVRLLLARGANPNAVSSYDRSTALHYGPPIAGVRITSDPVIVQMLLRAGAR